MKTKILIPALLLLLGSCKSAPYSEEASYESNTSNAITYQESKEEDVQIGGKSELPKEVDLGLKIIKNAQIRFLVKDVDSATQNMIELSKKYNGYVSNMRFKQNNYTIENSISMQIPSGYFEEFVMKCNKHAIHVDYNNITSDDVTEEFVDLNNRIRVKEEVKARYEDILRTKAKTVNDVLLAEKQIQAIQEEIEVAKGRVKYINTKSALSTINISLYEKVDYKETPEAYSKSFGSKTKEGFSAGIYMIETIVIVLIYMWPLLLGLAIGLFFLRRRIRKQKNKAKS